MTSISNVFHSANPQISLSNVFHFANPQISLRNDSLKTPVSGFPPSFARFPRVISFNKKMICAAASAGSSNPDSDLNPFEVLGVSPVAEPSMIKAAYENKLKEAGRNNDEVTTDRLDMAYDKILMEYDKMIMEFDKMMRLPREVRFGSFKERDDAWEGGEDHGQALRRRKRILFSLTLFFVCIVLSNLGYTGILNLIWNVIEYVKGWSRVYLFNNPDMLLTSIIVLVYCVLFLTMG